MARQKRSQGHTFVTRVTIDIQLVELDNPRNSVCFGDNSSLGGPCDPEPYCQSAGNKDDDEATSVPWAGGTMLDCYFNKQRITRLSRDLAVKKSKFQQVSVQSSCSKNIMKLDER